MTALPLAAAATGSQQRLTGTVPAEAGAGGTRPLTEAVAAGESPYHFTSV